MTNEEQNIFLKYVRMLYYGDIFEVALFTGMRNGEFRGLEWKDIDFEEKVIHVRGDEENIRSVLIGQTRIRMCKKASGVKSGVNLWEKKISRR